MQRAALLVVRYVDVNERRQPPHLSHVAGRRRRPEVRGVLGGEAGAICLALARILRLQVADDIAVSLPHRRVEGRVAPLVRWAERGSQLLDQKLHRPKAAVGRRQVQRAALLVVRQVDVNERRQPPHLSHVAGRRRRPEVGRVPGGEAGAICLALARVLRLQVAYHAAVRLAHGCIEWSVAPLVQRAVLGSQLLHEKLDRLEIARGCGQVHRRTALIVGRAYAVCIRREPLERGHVASGCCRPDRGRVSGCKARPVARILCEQELHQLSMAALDRVVQRCVLPSIQWRQLCSQLIDQALDSLPAPRRRSDVQGSSLVVLALVHLTGLGQLAE